MCFLRLSFWSQGLQSIGFVHKHHFVSRDVVFHEELFPFAFVSIVKSDPFMLEAGTDFTPQVIKDTFVTHISVFDDSNPFLSVFYFSTSHLDDNFNDPFTTPTTSPPLTSFDQTLAVEPSSQPLSSVPTDQSLPDPHLLIAEPPLVPTRRSTGSINHLFTYKIILVMLLLLLPVLAHLMILQHLSFIPIWSLLITLISCLSVLMLKNLSISSKM